MVGHNFYGQCGVARPDLEILYEPMAVQGLEKGERVVSVAVGFEHVLAVTDQGSLYSWGRGDRGQLGHGDKAAYSSAVRILGGHSAEMLDVRFVAVAAGVSHSAAVDETGALWVWGKMQVRLPGRVVREDNLSMYDFSFAHPSCCRVSMCVSTGPTATSWRIS